MPENCRFWIIEDDQSSPYIKSILLYMAPEILSGELCSKPGDVYAFGIIMYEIVTGKNPFQSLSFSLKHCQK